MHETLRFEFVDGTAELVAHGSPRYRELIADGHTPVGSVPPSDGISDDLQAYLTERLNTTATEATAGLGPRLDDVEADLATVSAAYARRMVVDANHPSTGIKADGTTDDAAAWNTLVAAQAPGTVITFTGRSKLGSAIIWKTGVSLAGQGWGNSILAPTHATNYFAAIKYTPAEGASTSAPLEDCTFRDFEVDGSGIAGTAANIGAKAIFAQFLRRCQFLNLYLHDTGATALGTDYMPECLIDGVIVERAGRNWDGAAGGHASIGIGMGAWEHEPVTIVNSHAIDCGHWGIFVEYQDGQAFRSRGARIVNCTVRGTEGVGIGDRGCSETLIQGCHVSNSGSDGIQVSYAAVKGQILDNTVANNTGSGIKFTTDVGDGWRVAGNKVSASGARGIYFDGSTATYSNHVIENNDLSLNQYQGILIDTAISAAGLWRNGVVRGNRCYNNGKAGTEADGIKLEADMSGVIVAGNRCYDDQGTKTQTVGIRFSASSTYDVTDVQVIDNHLVGNSSAGMTFGAVVRTRVDVRNNAGYVTEARGASQINDTGSTVTVLHGLAATPTSVVVTPQSGNEALWITTIGASGFIVNRVGTSGARPFLWQAEV